jgi:hypothetical protein
MKLISTGSRARSIGVPSSATVTRNCPSHPDCRSTGFAYMPASAAANTSWQHTSTRQGDGAGVRPSRRKPINRRHSAFCVNHGMHRKSGAPIESAERAAGTGFSHLNARIQTQRANTRSAVSSSLSWRAEHRRARAPTGFARRHSAMSSTVVAVTAAFSPVCW